MRSPELMLAEASVLLEQSENLRAAGNLGAAKAKTEEARNLIAQAQLEREARERLPRQEQPGSRMSEQETERERRRFSDFIRFGRTERRDLTTGGVGSGAEFIPQAFSPVLTEAQKSWGPIIGALRQELVDDGRPAKLGLVDDTSNSLHESGEPASVSETDPTTAGGTMTALTLDTGVVKVSVQELQDSAFDVDQLIRSLFGKRYFRGLTAKITNGSTAAGIESIVTGATAGPTTASGTAVAYDDLVSIYGQLDPAYVENASWAMNSATRAKLLGVKDSYGRPLLTDPNSGGIKEILGRPVIINQSLPDVAVNNKAIQFGDFRSGYVLRTVKPGLVVVRLNERYMDTLEVGFIGYCRVSGKVTDAGTHPILNLVQAAA